MKNSAVSFDALGVGINSNKAQKYSSNIAFSANKLPQTDSDQNKKEATKKRFTSRDALDAATVVLYISFIAAAIAMNKANPITKAKVAKVAEDTAKETSKNPVGLGYKLFDFFGKLKRNSEELTNNIVYGFGTLVVMPLVILFSPFGKKKATKEDRVFTVLRQPISFATLFTMQLTFDKIFKTLVPNLNKYKLLDGIKGKDGKELFFRIEQALDDLKKALEKDEKGNPRTNFSFSELINDKNYQREYEILEEHLKKHGNKFTLDEFINAIKQIAAAVGETPRAKEMGYYLDLFTKDIKDNPVLAEKVKNVVYTAARGKGLKEVSVVVANSIISQALGIMMLNFLYGKMMRKYDEYKHTMMKGSKPVEGGDK